MPPNLWFGEPKYDCKLAYCDQFYLMFQRMQEIMLQFFANSNFFQKPFIPWGIGKTTNGYFFELIWPDNITLLQQHLSQITFLNGGMKEATVVCVRESTKPILCSKQGQFQQRLHTLKVLLLCSLI